MLEPGMCPAETSLTPFVTRSLILLCFSVTHRGRGKDIPPHFFLQLLAASASASLGLGRETNPLPSLGLSPGLLRETFVSEGPFLPCSSAGAVLNALLMARGP